MMLYINLKNINVHYYYILYYNIVEITLTIILVVRIYIIFIVEHYTMNYIFIILYL